MVRRAVLELLLRCVEKNVKLSDDDATKLFKRIAVKDEDQEAEAEVKEADEVR